MTPTDSPPATRSHTRSAVPPKKKKPLKKIFFFFVQKITLGIRNILFSKNSFFEYWSFFGDDFFFFRQFSVRYVIPIGAYFFFFLVTKKKKNPRTGHFSFGFLGHYQTTISIKTVQ